jgi:hypothetical protein
MNASMQAFMTAFQGVAQGMAQMAQQFQANSFTRAPQTLLAPEDESSFCHGRSQTPPEEWIVEQQ